MKVWCVFVGDNENDDDYGSLSFIFDSKEKAKLHEETSRLVNEDLINNGYKDYERFYTYIKEVEVY